jgi:hypothetical protein
MEHREDLGDDRCRNLLRAIGTDVEAGRSVQHRQVPA